VVSGEDYGFGFGIVGGAAWVLASILVAVFALEAPFAVFGMTVTDEKFAATMGAAKGGSKHRLILPHQTNLSHYHFFKRAFSSASCPQKRSSSATFCSSKAGGDTSALSLAA